MLRGRRELNDLDIAILNRNQTKDIDLFIAYHNNNGILQITQSVIQTLKLIQRKLRCQFFVKKDHLGLLNSKRPKIHLLFYPSYEFLSNAELPSFLSFVYTDAQFVRGSNFKLKRYHKHYSERKVPRKSIFDLQLFSYLDLALTNLLYLSLNPKFYHKSTLFLNLIYVYRFTIAEMIIEASNPKSLKSFWHWDNFIPRFTTLYPKQIGIAQLFRNRYSPEHYTLAQIERFYYDYLLLIDAKSPERASTVLCNDDRR